MVAKTPKLSDEKLAESIKAQSKIVQTESKGTIINRWNAGKPITANQFKEIKSTVDQSAVKEYNKRVPVIDEKKETITAWKDQKMFVNKKVVRLDNAVKNDKADDATTLNLGAYLDLNSADHERKNISLHMQRSKLSSLKVEDYTRSAAKKVAAMKKADIEVQTLGQIYENAIKNQKMTSEDLADTVTESTIELVA